MAKTDGAFREFVVTRTPKIRDNEGNYVKRGQIAKLNKATAEHYHKLGYIQVTMDRLFDDDSDKQSDGAGAKPDSAVGGADEGEASADAPADAGADQAKESAGPASVARRRRVAG